MSKINVLGDTYSLIDTLEKISISDSFVLPSNKIGDGNGEAKLYIGQDNCKTIAFFGKRGFEINCIFSRNNLLKYLDNAYSEYKAPKQEYREKNNISQLWEERRDKIAQLETVIEFDVKDQDHIVGPRVYINATSSISHYTLLREIALPVISYINIHKLQNNSKTIFYFSLYLEGAEETFDDIAEGTTSVNNIDINRFVPLTDKNDVEEEIANDKVPFEVPFDPNKIKVRTTPYTIGQIVHDLEDDFINLDTEFQRLPNLWDNSKKSLFIESLLLRLPVPAFYFNEKEENHLEVVDGLQRISTIKKFVLDEDFKLSSLEFLKEYNDQFFSDLPSTLQRRIRTFPITVYIIEKDTPNDVKYNIFKRVNTAGLLLTDQEIRHAINQGTPAELISDLARGQDDLNDQGNIKTRINNDGIEIKLTATREGKAFIKATDNRIGTRRMQDRDFVTRFVSFYLIPPTSYEPNLDTFLNKGMSKIRELSDEKIEKLKDDFYRSMQLAFDIFGDDAFRKRINKNDARKPINKALFEVLSVSFSKLDDYEVKTLKQHKNRFIRKFIALHQDYIFIRAISQGTAMKESVLKRFQEIDKIIKQTLGEK